MRNDKGIPRCAGHCQRSVDELQRLGINYVPLKFAGRLLKEAVAAILEKHKKEFSQSLAMKLRELLKVEGDVLCEICSKNVYELFMKARRNQLKIEDVKDSAPSNHPDRLTDTPSEKGDALSDILRSMGLENGDTPGGKAK